MLYTYERAVQRREPVIEGIREGGTACVHAMRRKRVNSVNSMKARRPMMYQIVKGCGRIIPGCGKSGHGGQIVRFFY